MAYPLEGQNKAYMDYLIEEQSSGREPLPLEKWLEIQKQDQSPTMGQEIDRGLGYVPK